MCKLFVGVSDTVLDFNFTSGGSSQVFNDIGWNFKPFEPLLSNRVLNGFQIPMDVLFIWHRALLNELGAGILPVN
ncbi:hypothetical protein BN874_530001 [Candidatus Contendobacter odensis Run_B_J11]|uniref:Uncharacterized protein n=1 Tax=Candidatus Contendobacter odensis Run_B_J11 TaxID=1400861 RepID=A0A7U7GDZ0_9GAMM|nr:hypothetical protein BN874_530001 [Candidatus Contendobacter odensis Run_B_J11]